MQRLATHACAALLIGHHLSPAPSNALEPDAMTSHYSRIDVSQLPLVGAGGSGDVYVLPARYTDPRTKGSLVLKKSKPETVDKVRHECSVLRYLEKRGVDHVELCLDTFATADQRQAEILSPYFKTTCTPTSDFNLIADESLRRESVEGFVASNLQIMLANVAMTDLQFLLDSDTGVALMNALIALAWHRA